jgi:hypothetical protein
MVRQRLVTPMLVRSNDRQSDNDMVAPTGSLAQRRDS